MGPGALSRETLDLPSFKISCQSDIRGLGYFKWRSVVGFPAGAVLPDDEVTLGFWKMAFDAGRSALWGPDMP